MQYVVFHANVDAKGPEAFQEYYMRHIDGFPVSSEAKKQEVVQCPEATIERRVCEKVRCSESLRNWVSGNEVMAENRGHISVSTLCFCSDHQLFALGFWPLFQSSSF